MKTLFTGLVLLIVSTYSYSQQSLGKERVDRLKSSVVRVIVNNVEGNGTGFFVLNDDHGWIATCWHVVQPALVFDSLGSFKGEIRKIEIEFPSKERVEVDIPRILLNQKAFDDARQKDYCLLKLKTKPNAVFTVLKLGSWKNINEGDLIYSSGYPLGIEQPVFTQGMFSTKYVDEVNRRDVAWLDLTMNRGNSGGPLLKFGIRPQDDEVIGIATFLLTPFSSETDKLAKQSKRGLAKGGVQLADMQMFASQNTLAQAMAYTSIGVSGAVSIDYLVGFIGPKPQTSGAHTIKR